jgi:hypothetical protein
MGYETRIYVVYGLDNRPWEHDGKSVLTGVEIASLDLCKCGDGAVSNIINSHKIKDDNHPLYALYTRTTDENDTYVDFLRELSENENFVKILEEHNSDVSTFQKMVNNIEDGLVTRDLYNDKIVCVPAVHFLEALKEDQQQEKYRRFEIAIALLTSILVHFPTAQVLTYGH